MSAWIMQHPLFGVGLATVAVGLWWLFPAAQQRQRTPGLTLLVLGGSLTAVALGFPSGWATTDILFTVFGGGAVLSGVLMITSRNPVYAALWFALVTLGVCGLFVLRQAPFLAAATIIVYAGAIIVTFVFVIMLAQQGGETLYDQRSRQPLFATCAAVVLFGTILAALQSSVTTTATSPGATVFGVPEVAAEFSNPLSQPREGEALGTMHGLGRSLFGDYLFSVELAGTLLLIASIGAIAIAPRREGGTL